MENVRSAEVNNMMAVLQHPAFYAILHALVLLPMLYFRAIPLRDHLTSFERRALLWSGIALIVINAVIVGFLYADPTAMTTEQATRIFKYDLVLYYVVSFLPFALFARRFLLENIFIFGTMGIFAIMMLSLALYIVNHISVHGILKLDLLCLILLILAVCLHNFIKNTLLTTVTPFLGTDNVLYWRPVCVVPVAMLIAALCAVPFNVFLNSITQLAGRLLIGLATVFLCRSIAYDYELFSRRAELLSQIDAQKDYYRAMADKMHSDRRARHDFQHQLAAISAMASRGKTEEIVDYCTQLSALSRGEALPFTGNAAIDGVLYRYQQRAEQVGVPLELRGSFKPHSSAEIDICVALGNALENALTASAALPPHKRFAEAELLLEGALLSITVKNSFDGVVLRDEDNGFFSRKRDNEHGYGMDSIDAVCKAHGGTMTVHYDDNTFAVMILMNIED